MLNLRNYRLALTLLIILLPIKTYASDSLTELALKKIEALEQRLNSVETDNRNLRAELNRVSKKTQPSLKEIPAKVNYETFGNQTIGNKINNTSNENTMLNNDTSLWPGIYGGINAGYGAGSQNLYETAAGKPFWGNDFSFYNTSVTRSTSGALAGIQLGYNHVFANNILVGAETDFGWADIANRDVNKQLSYWITNLNKYDAGSSAGDKGLTRGNSRFGMSLFGTTRIRLGYDFGKFLPFISGGFAYGDLIYSSQGISVRNASSSMQFGLNKNYASKIATGWAVGAGAEYMVTNNLSLKGEYIYSQIGGLTIPGYGFDLSNAYATTYFTNTVQSSSFVTQQARFGLNYHTGWVGHIPKLIQTRD